MVEANRVRFMQLFGLAVGACLVASGTVLNTLEGAQRAARVLRRGSPAAPPVAPPAPGAPFMGCRVLSAYASQGIAARSEVHAEAVLTSVAYALLEVGMRIELMQGWHRITSMDMEAGPDGLCNVAITFVREQ